jgi:hypothetical protein
MNTSKITKNRINTILVIFLAINIIGDIGNVVFWHANPDSRMSLNPSYIGTALGGGTALIVGSSVLSIVAVAYLVALFGLLKKQKWGALAVIAISIANRVAAVFLYEVSAAFAFWAVWTIILVVLAYLDYRKFSVNPQTPSPTFTVAKD